MNCTRRRFLNRTGIAAAAGASAPAWLLGGCAPALRLETPGSAPADVARFDLGVASGHPSSIGMVLWTRLTGPGLPDRVDVRWELAHDEAFQRIAARGIETAEAAWAHSVHAEPRGLEPGRWYWYRFQALGDRSAIGRTRTAPSTDARSGAAAPLRFAIASCQRYDAGHYAA